MRHSKYLCVFKFECIQNKWVFKSAFKYFCVLKMFEIMFSCYTKHEQIMLVFTIRMFTKFNHKIVGIQNKLGHKNMSQD